MAFLRAFSDIDEIYINKIPINEEERYKVAKKMFDEDSKILYFYYFSDYAEQNNRFYDYPIQRHSILLP
jgi:hypothetical protein